MTHLTGSRFILKNHVKKEKRKKMKKSTATKTKNKI